MFILNVGLVALSKSIFSLLLFLGLKALFLFEYRFLGAFRNRCRYCYHAVLLKYPVFVFLLSPAANGVDGAQLAYAMATVYFCFGVYEILHDETLHKYRSATMLLGLEMIALALIAWGMLFRLPGLVGPRSMIQSTVAVGSCGILVDPFSAASAPHGSRTLVLHYFRAQLSVVAGLRRDQLGEFQRPE